MRITVPGGTPNYTGIMESLSLSLSALTVAMGLLNLVALKDAAPAIRKRASLIYCVTFACLGCCANTRMQ